MDQDTFDFTIYMIHACANKWAQSPAAVYKKMQTAHCIDKYLVPHYDVLHTQSTSFVVGDIEKYLGIEGDAI